MATESPVRLMPGGGGSLNTSLRTSGTTSSTSLDVHELSMLLKERSRYDSLVNGGGGGGGAGAGAGVGVGAGAGAGSGDVFMHRSESAPPSVEGSLAAVNGLLEANVFGSGRFGAKGLSENSEGYESEEQMRSDPAYLAYYYSHINLNPRLPPPIISWENLRLAQRLAAGNKESNWKLRSFDDNNSRSLFASQPLLPEDAVAEQKQDNGPVGPMSHGFGGGGRSLVDLIQQDFPRTPSPVYSYNHDGKEDNSIMSGVETQLMSSLGTSGATSSHMEPGQLVSDSAGRRSPYPTVRSASVEPAGTASQLGGLGMGEALKRSGSSNAIDLAAALQGLNMQQDTAGYDAVHQSQRDDRDHLRYRQRRAQRSPTYAEILEDQMQYGHAAESTQAQAPLQPGASSSNVFAAAAAAAMSYIAAGNPYYQSNMYSPQYGVGGYPSTVSPLAGAYSNPSLLEAARARSAASGIDRQQLYKIAGQQIDGGTLQDALYVQYLQRVADEAALRNYMTGSDSSELGYIGDPKLHYPRGSLKTNPLYYGRSPYYSTLNSASSSSLLHRETLASLRSGSTYGWHRGGDDDIRGSVLLEEFKSSKSRRFELSDIAGHVVEFSADQHGSRFIQQKLEAATTEEKAMVFEEVLPQAFTLMTDVFGNYVIQKFFEHGNSEQRRQLANLLVGHMLDLSLQMYGCRVIQKALEVCDIDQQTQLVAELDGYVMRCVRDQNGNHVIQKCIECVPPDKIQFIISAFYGQVLVLSTHPYGCRVIQRVLEHCTDDQKQAGIMEEILGATCSLAQDQYGNYVIQHVLEHGKPHERSEIITKLAGQFVQMSQHKFASNVVEKCLEFGGAVERQMLVDEMLGNTEDNLPLQAMMKDQYANYVVQKVLEICSDQQREMLLGRIKTHLHALKKYTYGKHIVARVEKLVAAGERRGAAAAAAAHSNS